MIAAVSRLHKQSMCHLRTGHFINVFKEEPPIYVLVILSSCYKLRRVESEKSKEKGKDQDSMRSITTPDPGHHTGK